MSWAQGSPAQVRLGSCLASDESLDSVPLCRDWLASYLAASWSMASSWSHPGSRFRSVEFRFRASFEGFRPELWFERVCPEFVASRPIVLAVSPSEASARRFEVSDSAPYYQGLVFVRIPRSPRM